ncbi:MAG: hypothetical protein P8Y71_05945 [Pseudolabrys sp.]
MTVFSAATVTATGVNQPPVFTPVPTANLSPALVAQVNAATQLVQNYPQIAVPQQQNQQNQQDQHNQQNQQNSHPQSAPSGGTGSSTPPQLEFNQNQPSNPEPHNTGPLAGTQTPTQTGLINTSLVSTTEITQTSTTTTTTTDVIVPAPPPPPAGDVTTHVDLSTVAGTPISVSGVAADTAKDILDVTGTTAADNVWVEPVAAYELRTNQNYAGSGEILLSNSTGNVLVEMTGIEEIVVHGSGGNDSLVISGDFSGTALLPSTVYVFGDAGNDQVSVQRSSTFDVVLDGGDGSHDKVVLDFGLLTTDTVEWYPDAVGDTGTLVITHVDNNGKLITATFTSIEEFQFTSVDSSFDSEFQLHGSTTLSLAQLIDIATPNAPSITSISDNVGAVQDPLVDGGSTDDTTPTIRVDLSSTGAVAGDTVQLYDGTTALGSAVTLAAGDITAGYVDITTAALTDGTTYDFRATVIDAAGNESPASTDHAWDITIDTTAPGITIDTIAGDDVDRLDQRPR